MNKRRTLIFGSTVIVALMVLASVMPAESIATGAWRLISPTEYSTAHPDSSMHGIFLTNGGTSGKGSGNGWAVSDFGSVFWWDGFSWNQAATSPSTDCQLDSVNFGGPLNPLTSVTSSSGWISGGAVGAGAGGVCAGNFVPVSFYYNGGGWVGYPVPTPSNGGTTAEMLSVFQVKSASFVGDSVDAWGVGEENAGAAGAFWHWSGVPGGAGAWSEFTTVGAPVNSVYMTHCTGSPCATADDGIAVGNGGTIYHWNGGGWVLLASPVVTHLYGVAMSSRTSGWAVGQSCKFVHTTDGVTWTGPLSAATCSADLRSIVLLSSSEGWAVGDADANGATIVHGTSLDSAPVWTRIPVNQIATLLTLNSVTFATSAGNLWAVGAGGVASFCQSNCGSQFASIWGTTTSPTTSELRSVFMDSDSDGWAVGVPDAIGNPTILRWDGGTFSWVRPISVSPFSNPTTLDGVYLSGGSSGWAVGSSTGPVMSMLYWDGNSWTGRAPPSPCTSCSLHGVFMISSSDAWAVGDSAGTSGLVIHSTTSTPGGPFGIISVLGPTPPPLFSVFFSDGSNGWAVGGDTVNPPTIIHTTNDGGDSWGIQFHPGAAGVVLRSVFFQDNTHGWAAGTGSTILFWNGVNWTPVGIANLPANPVTITGISVEGGTPATDGWAVGFDSVTNAPITIHFDGTTWTVTPLTPAIGNNGDLLGVSLRSSTNGLAVGQQATGFANSLAYILHLDPPGGNQQPPPPPPPPSTSTTASTSIVTSTQTSATSATTSQAASQSSSTSIQTTSSPPTTSAATTVVTKTVASTVSSTPATTQTSSTPNTTPVALPGIPGFPWESIIAGIVVGLTALAMIRRRRHNGA